MGLGQSCMVGHIIEGFCSCDCSSNTVYTPEDSVLADSWYGVGLPGFIFPELRNSEDGVPALLQKSDLAICLSGGGLRAAVASYGYVRGLHMLGILKRARYMNGNSGSAWFSGPFCYQNTVSTEDFLGEYIEPQDLTLEKTRDLAENSYGKVVADANHLVGILLRKLGETNATLQPCCSCREAKYRIWEDAIGDMLLQPYSCNEADSAFCLAGRESNAESAGVPNIYSACVDSSIPFPVITACVIVPERLPEATPFVSFEYTPLYSGVPTRVEDSDIKLGGVLVENFALCSLPPEEDAVESGKQQVQLDVEWSTPLAQAMGDSSQFLAMAVNAENPLLWDVMGCPITHLWNGIDHGQGKFEMTDGGGSDNLAIYPALRRGVKKLIICSALAVPISPTWAKDEFDISGYFGAYPDDETFSYAKLNVGNDAWNRAAQVFERNKWDELFATLTALIEQGRPQIIPMRLKVLPNKEQSIAGGYEVETVWIFNAKPDEWWNKLPEETRNWIDETETTKGFPIVSAFIVDYDPETVSVLSNVCTWQILQAQKELEKLLA